MGKAGEYVFSFSMQIKKAKETSSFAFFMIYQLLILCAN